MSDYWNDKGLYCAENCKNQGMPITAMYMKEIVQQRAELLEALKKAKKEIDKFNTIRGGEGTLSTVVSLMDDAITKAEAAE